MPRFGLARSAPLSLVHCSLTFRERKPIDIDLALRQQQAYCDALRDCGVELTVLPALEEHPDCCFVEDTAVILGDLAIVTWMGADSRNGEQAAVADWLAGRLSVVRMESPARLDGGDVLQIDRTIYVGRSTRTDERGISFLERHAAPRGFRVLPVPVPGALHLKTVVTYAGRNTLVAAASIRDEVRRAMPGFAVIEAPEEEASAANTLAFGNRILMPASNPLTAAKLERSGFSVTQLDISEFEKAEAGVTCLSLIL